MARKILQKVNIETGEFVEVPKFRTKYDAHHNQNVEHYDSEYLVDDTGYTPLKTLVERCIVMGNNPFLTPPNYQADVEVSEEDFASENFADKLDQFDDSLENPQIETPISSVPDVGVENSNPVDNSTAGENEVKASV